MSDYRYLLIKNNENALIYGERIEWITNKFDYKPYPKGSVDLGDGYAAYFFGADHAIEIITEKTISFSATSAYPAITFSYESVESEFVSQTDEEMLFRPLTGYCLNANYYSSGISERNNDHEWFLSNAKMIKKIKESFNVDLNSNPELLHTYATYTPSRIIVDTSVTNSDDLRKGEKKSKISVGVIDEFKAYQSLDIEVNFWMPNGTRTCDIIKISETPKEYVLEEFPQKFESIVKNGDAMIYHIKHGYITGISVSGNVITGTVELPNGKTQSVIHKSDFEIGIA